MHYNSEELGKCRGLDSKVDIYLLNTTSSRYHRLAVGYKWMQLVYFR
jgi:hypothetical protein